MLQNICRNKNNMILFENKQYFIKNCENKMMSIYMIYIYDKKKNLKWYFIFNYYHFHNILHLFLDHFRHIDPFLSQRLYTNFCITVELRWESRSCRYLNEQYNARSVFLIKYITCLQNKTWHGLQCFYNATSTNKTHKTSL